MSPGIKKKSFSQMTIKEHIERLKDYLLSFNLWRKKSVWYKVVRVSPIDGRLWSASPCNDGCLEYSTKRFTKMLPGSFGIYMFGNLSKARAFANANKGLSEARVYKCSVRGKPVRADFVLYRSYGIDSCFREERTRSARLALAEESYYKEMVKTFTKAPEYSYTVTAVKLEKCVASFSPEPRDI